MKYEMLELTRPRESIALVTLNRPEKLNAVRLSIFDEFHAVCEEVGNDESIRAVVMTGAGRAFSAGLDFAEADRLPSLSPHEMMLGQERWSAAMIAIHELPQPVIAAVNGVAAGGGMAFALAADIRIGSPAARFNAAFVKIGLTAGDIGVSWSLPRVVGLGHASEIMLTGRFVEAEEAERIGLLNRIVPAEELLDAAFEIGEQIAGNSPFGVTLSKRVITANVDAGSLRQAVEVENRGQTLATRGEDFKEALAAFREKRAPNFTGG